MCVCERESWRVDGSMASAALEGRGLREIRSGFCAREKGREADSVDVIDRDVCTRFRA
jgi:hypothetical protein